MRYAVIGSRNFAPMRLVSDVLSALPLGSEVISGGAQGVDRHAALVARRLGLPLTEIFPDYERYAYNVAPLVRNRLIIDAADRVLAFWNQEKKSTGTLHACRYALAQGKSVAMWRPDGTWASLA